ncbi:hypothetical protein DFR68_103761 [Nocardia mexicana]|uniref:Phospholipase A2-like protein n=1 Tax=Nocardia mexicana TaxID=279262 RepID=A0A370H9N6_9NOCA|nr:hypothetical protein DFR68_103761 [Nocardia mexicana]
MSPLRRPIGTTRRYGLLITALALLIGTSVLAISTRNTPQAEAKPINPYIPCPQWQEMHPGWPCFGNFPEIEEPTLPNQPPGQPAPTVPGPPALATTTPPSATTAIPPPAAALTPPPLQPPPDPCAAIIPVPGYIPPALPGNTPIPPCGLGDDRSSTDLTPTLPVQSAGLCIAGRNPDGSCRGHGALNGSGSKVEVPDDYIYDPDCKQIPQGETCDSWRFEHDYCSGSPDQLPSPGANADFSGPCARHDMCLAGGGTNNFCNNQLFTDMTQNCKYTYGTLDPRYTLCLDNAEVYWTVVSTIQPPWPGLNGPPWAN